jgi:hypothetical protein
VGKGRYWGRTQRPAWRQPNEGQTRCGFRGREGGLEATAGPVKHLAVKVLPCYFTKRKREEHEQERSVLLKTVAHYIAPFYLRCS